jgi:hypothetical protein
MTKHRQCYNENASMEQNFDENSRTVRLSFLIECRLAKHIVRQRDDGNCMSISHGWIVVAGGHGRWGIRD